MMTKWERAMAAIFNTKYCLIKLHINNSVNMIKVITLTLIHKQEQGGVVHKWRHTLQKTYKRALNLSQ